MKLSVKTIITSAFLLVLNMNLGFSQDLNDPATFLKIMEQSKLVYNLDLISEEIKCKDFSAKTVPHQIYRKSVDGKIETHTYTLSERGQFYFNKAENFFPTRLYDSTIYYYQKTLETDSSLSFVLTYIGQVYLEKDNTEEAIKFFKKAIEQNQIDYMAHWFLADAYFLSGNYKDAADEIVFAWILNRNNPRIKTALFRILEKAGYSALDFDFCPQVALERVDEGTINMKMTSSWMFYAMVKAVWAYEPGYRESKGVSAGSFSTTEEKEALLGLIAGIEKDKETINKYPLFKKVTEAVNGGRTIEFILFEILLPENPAAAGNLPDNILFEIRNYILQVRQVK
ncbi:MAG: tetratricopeptide repeat protein [Bacteroidetes bacterium]|nr:tetratricopeptide repeat protein [Bacteroidota bacterium]